MADKSQQLVLDALQRAAAEPGGMPLFGSRKVPGLFANNATGKKAAALCREQGYFVTLETDPAGAKKPPPVCTLSDRGLAYLFEQLHPRPVLESFVRAIEARGGQVDELLSAVQRTRTALETLKEMAAKTLTCLPGPVAGLPLGKGVPSAACNLCDTLLGRLRDWQQSVPLEDCPLPDLYRKAEAEHADLTIGRFHDAVRELQGGGAIYLHPWTGPLYQMPGPAFAVLIGHEIAYYASLRTSLSAEAQATLIKDPSQRNSHVTRDL